MSNFGHTLSSSLTHRSLALPPGLYFLTGVT
jgi:hypothetical protein